MGPKSALRCIVECGIVGGIEHRVSFGCAEIKKADSLVSYLGYGAA